MTQPPTRLLDDAQLSHAEREMLEAARATPPVHYDVAAGALRFQQTLATQATLTATHSASTSVITKLSVLHKLALIALPALGIAVTYIALSPLSPAPPPAFTPPTHTAAPVPASMPAITPLEHAPPPSPPVTPPPENAHGVAPAQTRPSTASRRSSSTATSHPTPPALAAGDTSSDDRPAIATRAAPHHPAPDAVSDVVVPAEAPAPPPRVADEDAQIHELRAIAQARALVDRDPSAALSLLQRLARAHPAGYFAEEREALTILALHGTGDHENAQARARTFLKQSPRSPFAVRIRAIANP